MFTHVDGMLHFMDPDAFDQLSLHEDILGEDQVLLLREGDDATLEFYEGKPVTASLPETVAMKVVQTAPHIKGATAAPQYKPAVLETGVKVSVPPFVKVGDEVVIDTASKSFVRRSTSQR